MGTSQQAIGMPLPQRRRELLRKLTICALEGEDFCARANDDDKYIGLVTVNKSAVYGTAFHASGAMMAEAEWHRWRNQTIADYPDVDPNENDVIPRDYFTVLHQMVRLVTDRLTHEIDEDLVRAIRKASADPVLKDDYLVIDIDKYKKPADESEETRKDTTMATRRKQSAKPAPKPEPTSERGPEAEEPNLDQVFLVVMEPPDGPIRPIMAFGDQETANGVVESMAVVAGYQENERERQTTYALYVIPFKA